MGDAPSHAFAARMRQARQSAGMTQAELAEQVAALLGTPLDSTAVTRIEKGERAVRLDEAVYIAQVLGVALMELLEG